MSRLAIICAAGIGDALILHIASHHLRGAGHEVTTFTNHLDSFGSWLPGSPFQPQFSADRAREVLQGFDGVVVQHDNTPKSRAIVALRPQLAVYGLYTNYRSSKHGPLYDGYDFPFDENQTMVANLQKAMQTLFSIDTGSNDNGLTPIPGLEFRKYPKRVVIHPTSASTDKNWPKRKFLGVGRWLERQGFEPVFAASPLRQGWGPPPWPRLEEFASFLYESGAFVGNDSGPGHLASYLGIPYLIIGRQERQMRLWKPGWHSGEVVTPPSWLPNIKGLRLREEKWKYFITKNRVIKLLKNRLLCN